jgi:formate dehydrogenase iron-sulfur subunit
VRPLTLADLDRGLADAALDGPALVSQLLNEQRSLSAVEAFSARHAAGELPAQARYYSRLLPASPPGPGEQYAFEVDLDRCSGCKSCVTACHTLNGLDDHETWRDVGLLVGGTETTPVLQHVTAACHHCLEPACMIACPVNAYEKDPVTGIVKHLDDQCFGCQYCTLACPYNVPKYHAAKGIVRKCDLCSHRLAQGEAPACAQACPHEAIAIRVVSIERVIEDSEADVFLPGAPDPSLTLPTTYYKTSRAFPRNTLPADYRSVNPEHPHGPLILMLVLTQLSVGAFLAGLMLDRLATPELTAILRPIQSTSAVGLGLLALLSSIGHLGRPRYAFRGILGLRHSWLSREILAFGAFAALAIAYAASCWIASTPQPLSQWATSLVRILGPLVGFVGGLRIFCSAMVYVFTKRELWSFERTIIRFGLTTAFLGIATSWTVLMLAGRRQFESLDAFRVMAGFVTRILIATCVLKLLYDLSLLRSLADQRLTAMKRSAQLVTGVLAPIAMARLALGVLGGIVLPTIAMNSRAGVASPNLTVCVSVIVAWLACLGGELLERHLFFAAVAAPRMPGGVRP